MTAWSTCSSPRAMSRRCRTLPMKDPNNLLLQGADGKFIEAGDTGRRRQHRQIAAARRWRISISTACSISSWSTAGRTAQVWRNTSAERRPLGRVQAAAAGARTAMRIGAWIEVKRGDHGDAPRNHRRRRPCQRPDGWWHFGLGDSAQSRSARALAGRQPPATGKQSTATISTSWSAASRRQLWTPRR